MDQHSSLLSGTVHGAAVQAGTVHGGVHLHPGPSRPVRPRQLPAPARCFVDRTEDLRRMSAGRARAAAEGDPVWVVISGPPGVGKTAMAVRWIRSVEADYPDGQIHVDLHGDTARTAERPQEVLSRLLREVGAGPASLDVHEAAARWRSATAGMRLAVLLDNARSAAQVEPLLMSGPGTLTVITSRWRLTELAVAGAELHQLGPLDDAYAHEPAALRTDPLTPLAVTQEHPVTQALDQALSALDGDDARLYLLAGLLPPQVPLEPRLAAALTGFPLGKAAAGLERLADAHLLRPRAHDTYQMHDLVRDHAARRAQQQIRQPDRVLRRAFDYHLGHVAAAERLLCPTRPPQQRDRSWPEHLPAPQFAGERAALGWLHERSPGLMALLREAQAQGWNDAGWQLVDGLWPLWHRLHDLESWVAAHRIGLELARASGRPAAVRRMLTSGAAGLTAAAHYAEAGQWYAQARGLAAEAGDLRDEGQALLGLGAVAFEAGRPADGAPALHQAIKAWMRIGYRRGVALALVLLGEISLTQKDVSQARTHFRAAYHVFEKHVDDPFDHSRTRCFLAYTHFLTTPPEIDNGMALLDESIDYFTSEGRTYWYGRALEMKAHGAQAAGDTARARAFAEQALEAWHGRNVKDIPRVTAWLNNLPTP
ncbi:regulator [Streptomyces albus]|uniref:regulator n=1 Tax=Streptomyces TaxID=1883 RepID=UPI00131DAC5A|nr:MULTISPECIES: regulator [Streptomyces]QID35107.1 regulator [Streptomyces albus]